MDTTSLIVWHSFLKNSVVSQEPALLCCLEDLLQKELIALPVINPHELELFSSSAETELDEIHHSWFSPFLRSLPEREIRLFLSALTPKQIKGLKQSLLLSNTLPSPSAIGASYLRNTLFQAIAPQDLIPIAALPPDPLNLLLTLSFQELLSLIDLLCMHDLAVEIRHIIDTSTLKEVYSLLTKPQNTFLKTLLHKKEPISFKKMGLLNWQKDLESLDQILTQRGINRIAKALYPRHKSLAWHLAHRLDMERGQLLLNLLSPLDHPKGHEILGEQVIELMDALNNRTPT